jgi:hypothetical protein
MKVHIVVQFNLIARTVRTRKDFYPKMIKAIICREELWRRRRTGDEDVINDCTFIYKSGLKGRSLVAFKTSLQVGN